MARSADDRLLVVCQQLGIVIIVLHSRVKQLLSTLVHEESLTQLVVPVVQERELVLGMDLVVMNALDKLLHELRQSLIRGIFGVGCAVAMQNVHLLHLTVLRHHAVRLRFGEQAVGRSPWRVRAQVLVYVVR